MVCDQYGYTVSFCDAAVVQYSCGAVEEGDSTVLRRQTSPIIYRFIHIFQSACLLAMRYLVGESVLIKSTHTIMEPELGQSGELSRVLALHMSTFMLG